ncbi:hypothetical protein AMTRI_Chr13g88240 [Amborella trichopoda]
MTLIGNFIPPDGHNARHSVRTPTRARKAIVPFLVILKLNYLLPFEDFWYPSRRVLHVRYRRALYVLISALPLPCTMSY